MREHDEVQDGIFIYLSTEQRVPVDHPLRRVRALVDVSPNEMPAQSSALYARSGRPSIAPEKLLRGPLLMEQLQYNLLFRWFVGLSMDDTFWDVTVFTRNRERLLEGEIAEKFSR